MNRTSFVAVSTLYWFSAFHLWGAVMLVCALPVAFYCVKAGW